MNTSSVALVDHLPRCSECNEVGNFAYGWNTLCMRCMFSKIDLVCVDCQKTNISITNYWDLANPKLLTLYRCIECVDGRLTSHTNFVTLSITPSHPNLDIASALMYIVDSTTLCSQCRQPHSNGKVLVGEPMMSLCVRCSTAYTERPTVTIRIYPGGKFMSV